MKVKMYTMLLIITKNTIKVQNKLSIFNSTLTQCKNLVIRMGIVFVVKKRSMA